MPVEQDHARSAASGSAAESAPGETQMGAEYVQQRRVGLGLHLM
jgi:hypothetical protein